MSQTQDDTEVVVETIPNTKVLRKRIPIKTLEFRKTLKLRNLAKRNQSVKNKRVKKREDKIKSQIRQEKNKKTDDLNHQSKECCLRSPKRTYQAIYNEINYPRTAILPDNTEEWDDLLCVEDMYDEYGLINYIIKLHKQMTSVYFMVRDLEYRYRGFYLNKDK